MDFFHGRPMDEAPGWYKPRPPSYIEDKFAENLSDLADKIESEKWFGDKQKHGRYRVDFILKDARLIIELDGYEYHSSKEQLENDAVRQRYLTRAGYSVIRFTGQEINRNVLKCVKEVRETYKQRMQMRPSIYRALYIDYIFLCNQFDKTISFLNELYPGRVLRRPELEDFIPHAIEWLHEKSFISAFIFNLPEDESLISHLEGYSKDYDKGEVRINTFSTDFPSFDLCDHMLDFSHLFDHFLVVADDPVYAGFLEQILNEYDSEKKRFISNGKLLRMGNHETSYIGTELVKARWQNIYYPIGASLGFELHEM
ncbi:endonuclease domain-containing protein [Klebsiella aerogenes]|uniref:endonuclease domain-containing protein n=1 Tax=Klebsiella aerogenes TaxID=548 RepID=UPI00227A5F96|nr:DUF559 domain-containing protein [Klebsiella aerogenes]EHW7084039.1 DUF559 domain-containing protein [Salmonella enterica]MCY3446581.1 DUF559 domain-containing protein [Klebsiella aerogenes]